MIQMSLAEIHWLAGLLEGEGCFTSGNGLAATVCVKMTDRDVVERAAALLGCRRVEERRPTGFGKKPGYVARLNGSRGIAWMLTLYSLLGARRRTRIREVVAEWRSRGVLNARKVACKRGHSFTPENTRRSPNGRRRKCRACEKRPRDAG